MRNNRAKYWLSPISPGIYHAWSHHTSVAYGKHCGNPVEFLVDAIEVEVVRIERAAVPIELVVVIGMAGIGDRFEEAKGLCHGNG